MRQRGSGAEKGRDSQIADLGSVAIQEDVFRFDIPVQEAFVVNHHQAFQDARHEGQGVLQGHGGFSTAVFRGNLAHPTPQAVWHIFHQHDDFGKEGVEGEVLHQVGGGDAFQPYKEGGICDDFVLEYFLCKPVWNFHCHDFLTDFVKKLFTDDAGFIGCGKSTRP